MFYMGLTTITSREFDLNFKIPNETVKRIDMDFLNDSLELEDIFKLNINKFEKRAKRKNFFNAKPTY